MLPEQIALILLVADALEALGVRDAIGRSFAIALQGVMRATMDTDLHQAVRHHNRPAVSQA
jgi:hypothetical protein